MKHLKYLSYLIRHKWFVLLAGIKIGAPLWRLIVHDLSKFRPSEWFAYSFYFYATKKEIAAHERELLSDYCGLFEAVPFGEHYEDRFNIAWLHHQHRNPHHWQYWTMREDDGRQYNMSIPREYLLEMVADWAGAGRAITGHWDAFGWYAKNKQNIGILAHDHDIVGDLLSEHFAGDNDGQE